MEAGGNVWGGVASWAQKARKAVAEQAHATLDGLDSGGAAEPAQGAADDDLESGDGFPALPNVWAWTKGAADRAQQGLSQAAQKTAGVSKAWSGDLSQTWNKAADSAAKAGAGFSENAMMVAGSTKDKFGQVGSSLSGMGALASPKRLIQFAGMFMVGMFLISLSISFLPLLPIKPQKFSLLFAMGSMTMLGSVAWLRGFRSFAGIAMQRDKLPWSGAYGIGLLGTFWATLIARSYLMTSLFATLQAIGLAYFMASFIPGGKAVLNFFGRLTSRGARALVRCGRRS